jgi:sulfoxide reductase heme-binding subunit YedZ
VVHFLNYLAFGLGSVHAILIGTDFQRAIVKAVPIAMAILVMTTLIRKRFQRRRR